jgi:hypothetical protein
VIVILLIACRIRQIQFIPSERNVLYFAALWIPAMLVLTVLVPVRSRLYALLPSIGSALSAGAVASAAARVRAIVLQTRRSVYSPWLRCSFRYIAHAM